MTADAPMHCPANNGPCTLGDCVKPCPDMDGVGDE